MIRTLIVDDKDVLLDSLERYLSTVPVIDVIGRARSAEEAIAKVKDLCPDLVFMDLRMPECDGLQATREIKRFDCPPFIIIVSPDSNGEYSASARAAGADGLISKREFPDRVIPVLEELFVTIPGFFIKASESASRSVPGD
jgi:DNA-binding NarL/FixJ family response regulator